MQIGNKRGFVFGILGVIVLACFLPPVRAASIFDRDILMELYQMKEVIMLLFFTFFFTLILFILNKLDKSFSFKRATKIVISFVFSAFMVIGFERRGYFDKYKVTMSTLALVFALLVIIFLIVAAVQKRFGRGPGRFLGTIFLLAFWSVGAFRMIDAGEISAFELFAPWFFGLWDFVFSIWGLLILFGIFMFLTRKKKPVR